jgi:hypothetical protein
VRPHRTSASATASRRPPPPRNPHPCSHHWSRHAPSFLPPLESLKTEHHSPSFTSRRRGPPPSRAAPPRATDRPASRAARDHPRPLDPYPTATSRSDSKEHTGQHRSDPSRLSIFSKRTVIFSKINPRSNLDQKYFRLGPFSFV